MSGVDLGGFSIGSDWGESFIPSAKILDLNVPTPVLPSQFAEHFINVLPHQPMSFEGREYLREIYDGDSDEILLKSGRQIEKTTVLGNLLIFYAIHFEGARVMYVSPSDRQTKTFSRERVRATLLNSPKLREFVVPAEFNVYDYPIAVSRAWIKLRSSYLTADRCRGEPADILILDEYQDLLTENIPVLRECTFHASVAWRRFYNAGTPKTMDNPIEKLWKKSTMTELMFPCRAHGESTRSWTWFWFPITLDCLGLKGLICPKCGKPVNHLDPLATWVDTATRSQEAKVRGYHISQVVTPMAHEVSPDGKRAWDEITIKKDRYPIGKFLNEVMGESFDHGMRPINESDMISCQDPNWVMGPEQLKRVMRQSSHYPVYAGIDWGGGGDYSYTVVALGTYALSSNMSQFFIFYWHRFDGKEADPELQLSRILDLLRGFNVRHCVADYGMGHYQNNCLVKKLSAKRFTKMQYIGRQNGKLVWRPKLGWITAHKSAVCADWIAAVKQGKIGLPSWKVFAEPFGADFLNVRAEYNDKRNETVYTHLAESAVDSFHAGLYCLAASLRDRPRPDITTLVVDESEVDPLLLEDPTTTEPYQYR